jgi:RNA polymerase sigma-70 factor (ECF subfamily)
MMGKVSPNSLFEALYREHCKPVLAYCMRRTRAADAADACAETFLVAWRRLDDIPPPPKTLPYLYGIASRVLSNQLRSMHRRSRLEEKLNRLGVTPPVDPAVLVLQNSRDREVVAAVNKLKPKDREIVMLYAWEDLPRDAIAEMMGMTKTAVDQRIHRSYQRLARSLEPTLETRAINSPPIAEKGGS